MQTGAIRRYDIGTGKELPALRGHTHWINSLLFADGGKTLIVAGWGHVILRYDIASGKRLPDAGGYGGSLRADRSPDGTLIAAGDTTGLLELLDGSTGQRVRLLRDSGGSGTSGVAFSPDGRILASGHGDGRLCLWEPRTGKLVREIELGKPVKGQPIWFEELVFTPDSHALALSARGIGMRMVEVETGKTIWDDPGGAGNIAFHADGQLAVTGGWDDQLSVRDAATGKVQSSAPAKRRPVDDIAIAPDGRLAATGHHDGFVCLRDPATGAVRKEWQAHDPGQVTWGVAFGPGGIWLSTAGDRTVKVWDTPTGKLLHKFEGHTSRAYAVRFAPDGKSLLSYSMDLTGYVWEVRPALDPAQKRTTEQLWGDLKGEPEAAFRAVWLAVSDPKAPELFGKKLPSTPKPDAETFKKLVGELASDEFPTRESAEKELAKFGPAAFTLAKKARADSDSPEVRMRLDRVMKAWTEAVLGPEVWRQKRAVVAMELAGTDDARKLLARWAADAPGTTLSDDAARAVKRLEMRGK
jgi:WD40 repeat protein